MKFFLSQVFLVILTILVSNYGKSEETRENNSKYRDTNPRRLNDGKEPKSNRAQVGNEFRYQVTDKKRNMHYHAQRRSKTGIVRGCYGYTDIKGLFRRVEYIADEGGFRVKIQSQEPGIHKINPAHIKMNVHSAQSGIGHGHALSCVDLETIITTVKPSRGAESSNFTTTEVPTLLPTTSTPLQVWPPRPPWPTRQPWTRPPWIRPPIQNPQGNNYNAPEVTSRNGSRPFPIEVEKDQLVKRKSCKCWIGSDKVNESIEKGKKLEAAEHTTKTCSSIVTSREGPKSCNDDNWTPVDGISDNCTCILERPLNYVGNDGEAVNSADMLRRP